MEILSFSTVNNIFKILRSKLFLRFLQAFTEVLPFCSLKSDCSDITHFRNVSFIGGNNGNGVGREIQRLISTQVPVRKIGEQIADEVKFCFPSEMPQAITCSGRIETNQ